MTTVKLTQDELDELGNLADGAMEDWLRLQDEAPADSRAWWRAKDKAQFWTRLAMKLGCKYSDWEEEQ